MSSNPPLNLDSALAAITTLERHYGDWPSPTAQPTTSPLPYTTPTTPTPYPPELQRNAPNLPATFLHALLEARSPEHDQLGEELRHHAAAGLSVPVARWVHLRFRLLFLANFLEHHASVLPAAVSARASRLCRHCHSSREPCAACECRSCIAMMDEWRRLEIARRDACNRVKQLQDIFESLRVQQ